MSFTCPVCRRTSHSPKDIVHRYCGKCNRTFDLKRWTLKSGPHQRLSAELGREFEAKFPGDPQPLTYRVIKVVEEEWGPTLTVEVVT